MCVCLIFIFLIEMKSAQHKMNHFEVNNSVALTTFKCWALPTPLTSKIFSSLQEETGYPLDSHSLHLTSLQPPKSPTGFLCLWNYIFQILLVNGITQYVTICVWLLLLSTMFLRLTHIVARVTTSFPHTFLIAYDPNSFQARFEK